MRDAAGPVSYTHLDVYKRQVAGRTQVTKNRTCGMNYYSGMIDLIAGRVADARNEFKACRETGVTNNMEFTLAGAELARMGN